MATERTTRQLEGTLSDLSEQVGGLVRQEVEEAKAELLRKAGQAGIDAGLLASAGLLAYVAFLAVVAALILLLAKVLPDWLAALVVGLALAGLAGPMAWIGAQRLQQGDLIPTQTINAVKRQVETATH